MVSYTIRESAPAELDDTLRAFPELTRHLLYHRGLHKEEDAIAFLNPDYGKLHDPYLLKDMDKAAERMVTAIKNKERIAIFSDYDADGIPGGVILHDFFRRIGYDDFENYIPDRDLEGFGLNSEAVKEIAGRGAKLLITVDCGIANAREIEEASTLGVDVIVTDHHLASGKLPRAYAIVNPNQPGCMYPDKTLCGAAVAWKLVVAVLRKERFGMKEGMEKWLLDMVGIATLSDMVPLRGENRILAHYGLKVLRMSPRAGLAELFDLLKMDKRHLTEDDIGFLVTPRINAASRLGHALPAFKLLATVDKEEGRRCALHLDRINDERKGLVGAITREAKRHIKERYPEGGRSLIVMGNPEWRPSLLGLVCNALMEEHGCPVFLWGRSGSGVLKGSCRSPEVSVIDLMAGARDIFLEFGGHAFSGGFSISSQRAHKLEEELLRSLGALEKEKKERPALLVERQLSLEEVTWDTYAALERFSPFGIDNPKPVFFFSKATLLRAERFGKEKNHIKLVLGRSGRPLDAIGFFMGSSLAPEQFANVSRANVIASIEKSVWRGFPELRLRLIAAEPISDM